MNTRAIYAADAVVRRYNSRNPEEIISRRSIKVKDIRYCRDLLGYYSVMLNCEYIGMNPNCTTAQRVSALAYELGHAFLTTAMLPPDRLSKIPIFTALTIQDQNGEPTSSLLNFCSQMTTFSSRLVIMNSTLTGFSRKQVCLSPYL